MKCKFCGSDLDTETLTYYNICKKCDIFFYLNKNLEIESYSKLLRKNGIRYLASYHFKEDLVILLEEGIRIGEFKGEVPLDKVLNKISLIKVFS